VEAESERGAGAVAIGGEECSRSEAEAMRGGLGWLAWVYGGGKECGRRRKRGDDGFGNSDDAVMDRALSCCGPLTSLTRVTSV
jgi:hypothetical protein